MSIVFETDRLRIEKGNLSYAELLHRLWSHPQVMSNVGFPAGLGLSLDEVHDLLARDAGNSEFGRRLIVVKKETDEAMGECLLRLPDETGIAGTDVKLLPEYWGHKYGVEVKQGLLDYLFTHTDCKAVEASPNIENVASIKMQRAVGGRIVDERVYKAPAESKVPRTDVHAYIFHVTRNAWEVLRAERAW